MGGITGIFLKTTIQGFPSKELDILNLWFHQCNGQRFNAFHWLLKSLVSLSSPLCCFQDDSSNATYMCLKIHCNAFLLHRFLSLLCSLGAEFVKVLSSFLQLLLAQNWVMCTLLDSSKCAVYFGTRLKTIWAANKNLKQNKWWKVGSDYVHLYFSLPIWLVTFFNFFASWAIGLWPTGNWGLQVMTTN